MEPAMVAESQRSQESDQRRTAPEVWRTRLPLFHCTCRRATTPAGASVAVAASGTATATSRATTAADVAGAVAAGEGTTAGGAARAVRGATAGAVRPSASPESQTLMESR
jgi:hypothetical protein